MPEELLNELGRVRCVLDARCARYIRLTFSARLLLVPRRHAHATSPDPYLLHATHARCKAQGATAHKAQQLTSGLVAPLAHLCEMMIAQL